MSRTLAVVPIRGGHGAKTRLSDMFSEMERSRLVWFMLRRVLAAIDQSGVIDHTLVVTYEPDSVSRQIGDAQHRTVLAQPRDRNGLNGALDLGRDWAIDHGYKRMMILSADVPKVGAEDVRNMLDQTSPVAIAPDSHGTGTNALLITLAEDMYGRGADARSFAFQFGERSRDRHLEEARGLGLETSTVCRDGLQCDLDTPDDWRSLSESTRDELLSVARESDEVSTCGPATCARGIP